MRAQAKGRPEPQSLAATRTLATENHPRKPGAVSQRARGLRAFLTHRVGVEAPGRNTHLHSVDDRPSCRGDLGVYAVVERFDAAEDLGGHGEFDRR